MFTNLFIRENYCSIQYIFSVNNFYRMFLKSQQIKLSTLSFFSIRATSMSSMRSSKKSTRNTPIERNNEQINYFYLLLFFNCVNKIKHFILDITMSQ